MRVILAITAAAALGWIGWWFFVAHAKEDAIADWLAGRRAEGWTAEAEAIEVGGFPYRVDTTLRGLELANPEAAGPGAPPSSSSCRSPTSLTTCSRSGLRSSASPRPSARPRSVPGPCAARSSSSRAPASRWSAPPWTSRA
jgi:hypothetical protein